MSLLLFILISILFLILVSGIYMFWIACAKRNDTDWLDEKAVLKTPNAQYYTCMVDSDRWLKAHEAKSVYTKAVDNVQLHALWIPAKNSQATVILAHGYRSTMLLDFHLGFELFHRLGLNILVPEQRTHGESGGKYITFGVKESKDMEQWIAFHNQQLTKLPVVLYGISMGASTMLYLADKVLPENVKGIIADCGFTSPAEILSSVYRKVIHIPAGPTLWVAGLLTKLFAGFSLWERDTRRSLANSKLPVLMIHGEADSFVPCEMTLQGYAACTGQKKLLIAPKAEHGLSFVTDGYRYTSYVIDFLKENVSGFRIPDNWREY